MRLDRVEIANFRSIKDVTITFEPRCRVLLGINESGKSNILNALVLLDAETTPLDSASSRPMKILIRTPTYGIGLDSSKKSGGAH